MHVLSEQILLNYDNYFYKGKKSSECNLIYFLIFFNWMSTLKNNLLLNYQKKTNLSKNQKK